MSKLKHTKQRILEWNKEQFGNIFSNKLETKMNIEELKEKFMREDMYRDDYFREMELLQKV